MAKDACCEGARCLSCNTVCENCVDSCPNRANVAVTLADGRTQIVHIDRMCNECGNCTHFCPYASEPCHDKFTLFQTAEDMADSANQGVLFLSGDAVRVRLGGAVKDVDLAKPNDLPKEIEVLILRIRVFCVPAPFLPIFSVKTEKMGQRSKAAMPIANQPHAGSTA